MNVSKFNLEYLTDILTKIKNENKNIILMDDFNVNLINYNKTEVHMNSYSNSLMTTLLHKLRFLLRLLKKLQH